MDEEMMEKQEEKINLDNTPIGEDLNRPKSKVDVSPTDNIIVEKEIESTFVPNIKDKQTNPEQLIED